MNTQILKLTNTDVSAVLHALGNQPYEESPGLIAKIESQRGVNEKVLIEDFDFEDLIMKPV